MRVRVKILHKVKRLSKRLSTTSHFTCPHNIEILPTLKKNTTAKMKSYLAIASLLALASSNTLAADMNGRVLSSSSSSSTSTSTIKSTKAPTTKSSSTTYSTKKSSSYSTKKSSSSSSTSGSRWVKWHEVYQRSYSFYSEVCRTFSVYREVY